MTVQNTNDTENFSGNGVATSFPFSIQSQLASDVKATHIDVNTNRSKLVKDTDYSVTLNDDGTSTVVFPLGLSSFGTLATGETLEVRRIVSLDQLIKLDNQGPYDPKVVEKGFDKLTQMMQQVVPDVPAGASYYVYWDEDGEPQLGITKAALDGLFNISVDSSLVLLNIATMTALVKSSLSDGDNVYVLGYSLENDGGGGRFYWDSTNSDTVNGFDTFAADEGGNGRWKRIINGNIHVAMAGVNGTNDAPKIQAIIDAGIDNKTIVCGNVEVDMDAIVTITDSDNFKFVGGSWFWNHTGLNMLKLAGTLNSPQFIGMKIRGTGTPFAGSQGAIGCSSGTITTNWLVRNCKFNDLPFGVYFNADNSGTHTAPRCINSTFTNIQRVVSDVSGMGNGLVFASDPLGGGGTISGGRSVGNTFIKCGRHGLYVANGGNVTSINDHFYKHRDDGLSLTTSGLAACHFARAANNIIQISPRYERCKDVALAIQGVQTSGSAKGGTGVAIVSPVFDGNLSSDIEINNDSPSVNGFINNVSIKDVLIKQYGTASGTRIFVFAGIGITIKDVQIEADLSEGILEIGDFIKIDDFATVSQFNNILIENINGTDAGSTSNGVRVDTGILTGTHALKLVDIKFGSAGKINEQVTPTNANYRKIIDGQRLVKTAFTASFTNKASEINTVWKEEGTMIWSLSGGAKKPFYAQGPLDTDVWVDATGTTVHTPV